MNVLLAACILAATVFHPTFAPAFTLTQWQLDGTPVCTARNIQDVRGCVSDGAGGAIVVWRDDRSSDSDLYAQRINALGTVLWTTDGVAICTAVNNQEYPMVVSDGAGGAIVTWRDRRTGNYDIYAQRINSGGTIQWAINGVAICTLPGARGPGAIAADGAGGAIITWFDDRSGISYDVFAQRINAAGAVQWAVNGSAVCTAALEQYPTAIVADGTGGAIISWLDFRAGPGANIYTQRVNAAGAPQWTADGVALCTATGDQGSIAMVSDNAGGAVVTWNDNRSLNWDVYAQRVSAAGVALWTADGALLCFDSSDQYSPAIVSDGGSGAVVAWEDTRNVTHSDVYAQRISASGTLQWAGGGVPICIAAQSQILPAMVSDGAGGAVVVWIDYRNTTNWDLYTQKVNSAGAVQWAYDGMPICSATGEQGNPTMAMDGAGGAIVAWYDGRSGGTDIYAQRVEGRYGYWGRPEPIAASVRDVPADQGGKVRVNWYASGRDVLNSQFISHYSIWRAASSAAAVSATSAGAPLVSLSQVGKEFSGPAIREEKTQAGTSFWELIGTQEAIYLGTYAYTATTGYDSTAAGPATHDFQVIAHAYWSQFINWPSNVVSGRSVDNLAPAAPLYLTALRAGPNVNLKWNRVRVSDLKNYSVYRATSSGVTPVPLNFLASATDTVLVDAGAPGSALYYIVTAKDVHENQGPASNEASVGATTNVGKTPALTTLSVLQNHPNPFTGSTELEIGLPEASRIDVEVYDVSGARVSAQAIAGTKGWQKVPFAAVDENGKPLSSGVYFYKVHARGETVTRKMVIAR